MSLEIIGLSKTFTGKNFRESILVLEKIEHRIESGRFVSIIDPSGCGKTTLLRIISGLETASAGKMLLDEKELVQGSEEIGMVFQDYALFPWRTTLQNIEMGLEIRGDDKEKRRYKALEYINNFDLSGFENHYPSQLSGGMKQRVAIARTLIMNPRIVLMDEPFGSLDSQTRNSMQEFLLRIWEKRSDTIIFVTHNVDEAVFLSDQIIILSKRPGRIIKILEVKYSKPRDRTSEECNKIRRDILKILEDRDEKEETWQ